MKITGSAGCQQILVCGYGRTGSQSRYADRGLCEELQIESVPVIAAAGHDNRFWP